MDNVVLNNAVAEPATMLLLGSGMVELAAAGRKLKKHNSTGKLYGYKGQGQRWLCPLAVVGY